MKIFKNKDLYTVVSDDMPLRWPGEVEISLKEALPFLDLVTSNFLIEDDLIKQSLAKGRLFSELADKMLSGNNRNVVDTKIVTPKRKKSV